MTDEVTEQPKPTTLSAWKKAATHYPLLESGVRVGIRIPDLPALIESGDIPDNLLDAAINVAGGADNAPPTKDLIVKQREFTDLLVTRTVVEPKITVEDAAGLPYEDKVMLVNIAIRRIDLDAEGEQLAGLTKSEKYRKFRQLGEFEPRLEGL